MNIPERSKDFEMKDGFLTKGGLVVVPISMKDEMLNTYHNRSGHYKVKPTTEKMRESFTGRIWIRM